MSFGIDYSWGHPSIAELKAGGVKFVVRYLNSALIDDKANDGKEITKEEAHTLSDAGIEIVLVWETTGSRAGSGHAAGVADAKAARTAMEQLAVPAGKPVYFAVDYDTAGPAVQPYFEGVISVLGLKRVGAYGGYRLIKFLAVNNLATYLWQTYAWSSGKWFAGNNLEQYLNGAPFHGHDVDYNRSKKDDFGQWNYGKPVPPKPAPWKWNGKAPSGTPEMKAGSKSTTRVKMLQSALDKIVDDLKVDGIFGPNTTTALEEFQTKHKLSHDGVYGPKSAEALMKALGA